MVKLQEIRSGQLLQVAIDGHKDILCCVKICSLNRGLKTLKYNVTYQILYPQLVRSLMEAFLTQIRSKNVNWPCFNKM